MSIAFKLIYTCVLSVAIFTKSTSAYRAHFFIYEDVEFSGAAVDIEYSIGICADFGADWQNRVSSVNTKEQCVEMFTDTGCRGSSKFFLPGSPGHNNLKDLGLNDATKSFRSCNLEETCHLCPRAMDRNGPEYLFWYNFFGAIRLFQQAFINQVERDGRFITWRFLLGDSTPERPGDQYQDAIEWMRQTIDTSRYTRNWNLDHNTLENLKGLANRVVNLRVQQNAGYPVNWDNRKYVVHVQIIRLWNEIVEVIKLAIEALNDEHDELRRRNQG